MLKSVWRTSLVRRCASATPSAISCHKHVSPAATIAPQSNVSLFPSRSVSTTFPFSSSAASTLSPATRERIESLVKGADVVVFMKGVPEQPRCGFSNAVVQIMRMHDVKFEAHDILKDEELRQGIKEYSNWPTIPQIFFKGEFVGGCDILLQMHQSGELIEELEKIGIKSALIGDNAESEKK